LDDSSETILTCISSSDPLSVEFTADSCTTNEIIEDDGSITIECECDDSYPVALAMMPVEVE